jgi:ribonucleotide monophosphatase NagD (HAD superfamily)
MVVKYMIVDVDGYLIEKRVRIPKTVNFLLFLHSLRKNSPLVGTPTIN